MTTMLDLECTLADLVEDARIVRLLMGSLFESTPAKRPVTILAEDAETLLHAAVRVMKTAREASEQHKDLALFASPQETA